MGEIYSKCAKIFAHLGHLAESDKTSNDWSSISLMNLLTRIWEKSPDHIPKSEVEWETILSKDDDGSAMWSAFISFWLNPWFTRCWIVQEAVLTKEAVLFYGNATCSLDAITTLWDFT